MYDATLCVFRSRQHDFIQEKEKALNLGVKMFFVHFDGRLLRKFPMPSVPILAKK